MQHFSQITPRVCTLVLFIIIGLITVNSILLIVWSSQDPLLLEILLGDEAISEGIIVIVTAPTSTFGSLSGAGTVQ